MATRKVMIGFKADIEVRDNLEKIAEIEDRSISYLVNKFVRQGIERWLEERDTVDQRAEEALNYIEELDFVSYTDFLVKTKKANTYDWINDNLGALQAYMVVCDKLNIPVNDNVAESIELEDMLENEESAIEE